MPRWARVDTSFSGRPRLRKMGYLSTMFRFAELLVQKLLSTTLRRSFGLCLLLAIIAHASAETPLFVREGLLVDQTGPWAWQALDEASQTESSTIETASLGSGYLLPLDWSPGRRYCIESALGDKSITLTAPLKAAPYRVCTVPLEEVGPIAITGTPPDSMVRFAPDSRRLAIGTLSGRLRVVDAYSGEILHQQRIAEGQIKQLGWSPDGRQLYVGEQSPDAYLFALDAGTLDSPGGYRTLWRIRLADDLESSRPPAGDRFGIYSLPAVHDLQVAADGRLFVAGMHSWYVGETHRTLSAIYAFSPTGERRWRFPADAPLQLTVTHLAVDQAGRRLVFLPNRSGPNEETRLEPNTLYQLDAIEGRLAGQLSIEPWKPHFQRIEAWDSVALSSDGSRAAVGLADGRALLLASGIDQLEVLHAFSLGTPLMVGKIPVTAACSYTRFFGDQLFLQTQNTHIPFGSSLAAHHAPSAHRGSNALTVVDRTGKVVWRYRGPFCLSGQWSDRSLPQGRGRWLLVTCRELPGAVEPGQFGGLVFDRLAPGGGRDKLVYHYPTEGPVIFHADISPDGRLIALTETPAPTSDGRTLYGSHQVHVVH